MTERKRRSHDMDLHTDRCKRCGWPIVYGYEFNDVPECIEEQPVAANDVPQAAVAVVATDDCPAGEMSTRDSSCSDDLIAYAKQEKP